MRPGLTAFVAGSDNVAASEVPALSERAVFVLISRNASRALPPPLEHDRFRFAHLARNQSVNRPH